MQSAVKVVKCTGSPATFAQPLFKRDVIPTPRLFSLPVRSRAELCQSHTPAVLTHNSQQQVESEGMQAAAARCAAARTRSALLSDGTVARSTSRFAPSRATARGADGSIGLPAAAATPALATACGHLPALHHITHRGSLCRCCEAAQPGVGGHRCIPTTWVVGIEAVRPLLQTRAVDLQRCSRHAAAALAYGCHSPQPAHNTSSEEASPAPVLLAQHSLKTQRLGRKRFLLLSPAGMVRR
jgi:hypothetical protein